MLCMSDLTTTGNSQATNQALRDFSNAWMQLKGDTKVLVDAFVTNNPNPPEEADEHGCWSRHAGAYSVSHSKYNRGYRQRRHPARYSDIYLIGADGGIYYTVRKADDYTLNVIADGESARPAPASPRSSPKAHCTDRSRRPGGLRRLRAVSDRWCPIPPFIGQSLWNEAAACLASSPSASSPICSPRSWAIARDLVRPARLLVVGSDSTAARRLHLRRREQHSDNEARFTGGRSALSGDERRPGFMSSYRDTRDAGRGRAGTRPRRVGPWPG